MSTRIVTPAQLRTLAGQLRGAGDGDLVKELRAGIRKAAGPARADAREAVLALHVTGSGEATTRAGGGARAREGYATARLRTEWAKARARRNTGLRQTVAAATGIRVRARGVRIEVDSSRLPPDQRTLPRHLESDRGWRHPVYGNRNVWAHERGGAWFYPAMRRNVPAFHEALGQSMDVAAAKLAEKVSAA